MWQATLHSLPRRLLLLGRLTEMPLLPPAARPRVLYVVLLVGVLSLTIAAAPGGAGELPRRGLTVVVESAKVIAARLSSLSEDDCRDQTPLLPFPDAGDGSFSTDALRLVDLSCDEP